MSGATTREEALLAHHGAQRGQLASLLAGWLLSIGQTSAVKEVLAVLSRTVRKRCRCSGDASLSDDANRRQQFIAAAEHCHAHNVRFPNSLDEVQMLRSLGDNALLPAICSVASGTANVRAMTRR
ncbi:hypothetical protein MJK72_21480 [Klebsiella pneumoniae]|nr:hypothetical protein MJK72_21480 [Klebsiella pneumoniae]